MIPYHHIAQRLFNTPLALAPSKAEAIVSVLRGRFGIEALFDANGQVMAFSDPDYDGDTVPAKGYDIIHGLGVIPVSGTLVQKSGNLRPYCGMTGYDGIRANLSMALDDETVKAIALDIDSPGGEVAGCFDLVDAIYKGRGQKPIWAILTECAYSAAYAIASSCDKIVVPRTGGTGSVGVISMHTEFSRMLDKSGVTVTLIKYGARKAEGNEVQPLSDEALARFQADVDKIGEMFVDTVARNRQLSAAKVRSTEAGTFLGADGVRVGFADAVMAPDEAFASLLAELG